MKPMLATTAALALAVSGCASSPRMDAAERLSLYRAHAGQPVNSILHPGRFTGWSPLGPDALVLRTRPNQAYLLELSGPCSDLPFAHAIRISSRGGTIASRFDSVTPAGPGISSIQVRCHIQSIRPLDLAALRQAERDAEQALREATAVEREDDGAPPRE